MKSRFCILMGCGLLFVGSAWADEPVVPGDGFPVARYETLWTKSPFSVATIETAPDSPDYSLVGMSRFDNVSYANIVDKKTLEHFIVGSDKPVRGLTLLSLNKGSTASDSSAVIQKDGQPLTLKLEQMAPPAVQPPPMANVPGMPPPPGMLPASMPPNGMMPNGSVPPQVRVPPRRLIHAPTIRVPPPPVSPTSPQR